MSNRLYRSRRDRMLFGVAGGIARYLDLDPSIVRIAWVLLVFAGGAGILLYIIAAIVIPEEPEAWTAAAGMPPSGVASESAAPAGVPGEAGPAAPWSYRAGVERRGAGAGAILIGVVLVIIGAWFLLRRVVPAIDSDLIWPVVLVGFGAALLIGAMRRG